MSRCGHRGARQPPAMTWLPTDFVHPPRADLPGWLRLRPISAADAALDHPPVMGARERLWSVFGEAWGRPAATIAYEANRADLERHAAGIEAHESFTYVLFDATETTEYGCVHIDPPEKAGADAEVSWRVVDERAGTSPERDVDTFVPRWIAVAWVPRWIAEAWPFERPRPVGRDLSWKEWPALPDRT